MKRLLILLLLLPVVLSFSSLRRVDVDHGRKALTVFIGNYPEDSGWNMIHAGNDRELILGMLHRMGFKSEDIICLEDSEATCRGILSALGRLESMLEKGDEVYVHFSCHGQQITDQDGDEALLNPGDRYDEAIVPYDAYIKYGMNGYKGENHLIDDVLNRHFSSITDKIGSKGRLLVVNDACHSGGIERGKMRIPCCPTVERPTGSTCRWLEGLPHLKSAQCRGYQSAHAKISRLILRSRMGGNSMGGFLLPFPDALQGG